MGRGRLSESEIETLRRNPYVSDVSESRIIYKNEFKFLYMMEYLSGKTPANIFEEYGFDTKVLGSKRIERASRRWKESYEAGSLGTYADGSIRKNETEEDKKRRQEYNNYLDILQKLMNEIIELRAENQRLREGV